MNIVSRGIRNAFRNLVRTFSIVIILGLSMGLALAMLVAYQAVGQKINSVKSSVGNTITIAPAGFSGFSQVNNSLTTTQLAKVSSLPHVTGVVETLTDRLTTNGSTTPSFGGQSSTASTNNKTSLTSPVTLNFNKGGSGAGGGGRLFVSGGGALPTNFTPPVTIIGTTDPTSINSESLTVVSGSAINGSSDTNDAMISKSMAAKNNLTVGSTFTAYSATLTVKAIFTVSSNETDAGSVIVSLPTEQRLSSQTGDVTSAVATVDSVDNLNSVTSAIQKSLGSSADVTSAQTEANNTVAPLNSVKTISLYSLIGAGIAGAFIILLTMIMIVRERRREIGVIKAIGASNLKIMAQFMTEAITLTVLGSVIGIIIGVVAGNPITKLLVNNSTTSTTTTATVRGPGGGGGFFGGGGTAVRATARGFGGGFRNNITAIHGAVGWSIILYGLAAAIIIAVIGSLLASYFISKVRPAEVMRVE